MKKKFIYEFCIVVCGGEKMFKDEIWVEVRVVDRCLELIKDVVNEFEDGWVVERVVKEMLEMCKGWLVDGDERKKKIDELLEMF